MRRDFRDLLLGCVNKLPYQQFLSSRRPVVLLYHGVPRTTGTESINRDQFERQIIFLKDHFQIVNLERVWELRAGAEKICVALTFDDGFRNHADIVVPILRKYSVPAMFFVCSRHSMPGKYLWFAYLRALHSDFLEKGFKFRQQYFEMSASCRDHSINRLRTILLSLEPHPEAMYEAIEKELPRLDGFISADRLSDLYAGMTSEQVYQISRDPLFSIGVHTLDHPLLAKCRVNTIAEQIGRNKKWIEEVTGKLSDSIAYPSGDYTAQVLMQCRAFRLTYGYALTPKFNTDASLEIPRIGIYSSSLDAVRFKVQWGNFMRMLKIKFG